MLTPPIKPCSCSLQMLGYMYTHIYCVWLDIVNLGLVSLGLAWPTHTNLVQLVKKAEFRIAQHRLIESDDMKSSQDLLGDFGTPPSHSPKV